jgi:hypothetical protein
MAVNGQFYAYVALPSGKSPGFRWVGSWVGPRACLGAVEKIEGIHWQESNSCPQSVAVAIPSELFRHHRLSIRFIISWELPNGNRPQTSISQGRGEGYLVRVTEEVHLSVCRESNPEIFQIQIGGGNYCTVVFCMSLFRGDRRAWSDVTAEAVLWHLLWFKLYSSTCYLLAGRLLGATAS